LKSLLLLVLVFEEIIPKCVISFGDTILIVPFGYSVTSNFATTCQLAVIRVLVDCLLNI